MKASELLSKAVWHTVPKGRIERISWVDGYLLVFYGGKPDKQAVYVKGPNVDAAEMVPQANQIASRIEDAAIWERYGN